MIKAFAETDFIDDETEIRETIIGLLRPRPLRREVRFQIIEKNVINEPVAPPEFTQLRDCNFE